MLTQMRSLPLALLVLPFAAVFADDSSAPMCRTIEQTFNSLEVACALPATHQARAIEFIARFSGGHDDTLVTIAPRVGEHGSPCDDGSKLRSFGEDGDIELKCTVTRQPGDAPADLTVLIKWSHAEYAAHALQMR